VKNRIIICLGIMLIAATAVQAGSISTDTTIDLTSGVFRSVHYDTRRDILTLTFNSGAVYDYYQVSRKTYETFMRTRYKGSFFHAHIRTGYTWQRMDKRQVVAAWKHAN